MDAKKIYFYSGIPAFSGGVTGIILSVAASLKDGAPFLLSSINFRGLVLSVVVLSAVFTVLWMYVSVLFSKIFRQDINEELKINALFFTPGAAAVFVIPFFIRYYETLRAVSLKVVGFVYIPFKNYVHFDFAGYFLIMILGIIFLSAVFGIALRFAFSLYKKAGIFYEKDIIRMVFIFFFIFYGAATSFVTLAYPPTGDEPHYLLLARSIGNDMDVNLENDYVAPGTYGDFYPVGLEWKNIHNSPDKNGKGIYSLHSPGLPALISLFLKFTGRFGVQLFMNMLCALLMALLYMTLRRYFINEKNSLAAVLLTGLTAPVAINSSLVLTEVPAALIIIYALYVLAGLKSSTKTLWMFVSISFLPFLHSKLILAAAAIYLYYYWKVFGMKQFDWKKEAVNNAPVVIFAAILTAFYYSINGKFAPFALASIYVSSSFYFIFSLKHAVKAAVAIFFDRDFGLLPYNLAYITAIWGIMLAVIRKNMRVLAPLLMVLPYFAAYFFWSDWGGSMTPARQMIPIVPALVLCMAYFFQETGFTGSVLMKFFAGYSLLTSFILMAVPALRYTSGKEKIYAVLQAKAPAILWIFPSFSAIITFTHAVIILYIALIIWLFFKYAGLKKA